VTVSCYDRATSALKAPYQLHVDLLCVKHLVECWRAACHVTARGCPSASKCELRYRFGWCCIVIYEALGLRSCPGERHVPSIRLKIITLIKITDTCFSLGTRRISRPPCGQLTLKLCYDHELGKQLRYGLRRRVQKLLRHEVTPPYVNFCRGS
jgi:hypothetical protein